MARSKETYSKKEIHKRKEKKKKEKEKKKLERKESESKGSLDDMIAYVDEFGRITSTPPEKEKEEVKLEDIEIGVPRKKPEPAPDPIREGVVNFYNESKGYGFIKDKLDNQTVFVHANNLLDPINVGNLVIFEIESGPRGPSAIRVKLKNKVQQ